MILEIIPEHEVSRNAKDKYLMISFVGVRYLTTDTNGLISTEKDTHRLRKQLWLSKRKGGSNGQMKITVAIRTPIHIKYIYQKDRPYTKGGLLNTVY